MRTGKRERVTFADRFFTAFLSAVLVFVVCLLCSLFLLRGAAHIDQLYYWYWRVTLLISVSAGVVGFFVGSRKMAEVFGSIFRTNKPKDGHWY